MLLLLLLLFALRPANQRPLSFFSLALSLNRLKLNCNHLFVCLSSVGSPIELASQPVTNSRLFDFYSQRQADRLF